MYGKIYEQTFTGSMVGSGGCTFAVWAYVIAHTKPDSLVELNPHILASVLGETVDKVQNAIDILKSEDPSSRSKTYGGRRLIEKGPFLYFVPNYLKYRGLPNDETRRSYFAEKQRERRARLKTCQTVSSNDVKDCQALSNNQESGISTQESKEVPPNPLKGGVGERFSEWKKFRRGLGKKPKDWEAMFQKQAEWLTQFSVPDQLAILDQSIRNGWQGLFEVKKQGRLGFAGESRPKTKIDLEYEDFERRQREKGET